jgi:diguanylate cyclase (GGDEF)-like protein
MHRHAERAQRPTSASRPYRRALFDLVWLFASCVGVYLLGLRFDVWERFIAYAESLPAWQKWRLDELLLVTLVLPAAVAVFTLRRLQEVYRLLQERETHIESLRCANEQIAASRTELREQAMTDKLTGLANRSCLLERLDAVLRADREGIYAVLFLDFDHFKRVNDSFGHEMGDSLLRMIAQRLRQGLFREGDHLARLGGDEFVILLTNLSQPTDAESIAQRVIATLSEPLQLGGSTIGAGVSVGIVIVDDQYQNSADVLRDADMAMYEAKRLGRGRYVMFDSAVRKHLMRRVRLESDLRDAVRRGELYLAYQPIVSLVTGDLVGLEALARWDHTELGAVSPGEFIPIAEESDLILEIGDWVLREGCAQMSHWIEQFPSQAPQVLSLNLSRKQFSQSDLPQRIARIIREAGVPAERIQIEITEDMYIGDIQAAIGVMRKLKELGVLLAMDDFGVGASSLSALRQFPIDVLKVDRSLVTDTAKSVDSAAIMHSLALLVRNMDVKLVAEGVEDHQQVIALQDLGCQFAQGFLFGRPMPVEAIEARFAQPQNMEVTAAGASAFGGLWANRLAAFQRIEIDDLAKARD